MEPGLSHGMANLLMVLWTATPACTQPHYSPPQRVEMVSYLPVGNMQLEVRQPVCNPAPSWVASPSRRR
jgi:hypothetical protein